MDSGTKRFLIALIAVTCIALLVFVANRQAPSGIVESPIECTNAEGVLVRDIDGRWVCVRTAGGK